MELLLISCPFCGEENDLTVDRDESGDVVEFYVICNYCWSRSGSALSEGQSKLLWNTRID